MTTKNNYSLSSWKAQFLDPKTESSYRHETVQTARYYHTYAFILVALYFFLYSTFDFFTLNINNISLPLFAIESSLIFLGLIFSVVSRYNPIFISSGWPITLIEILGFISFFFSLLLHSGRWIPPSEINFIFMVISVYLFLPNLFSLTVLTAIPASLIFAIITLGYSRLSFPNLFMIGLPLLSINLLGALSARTKNIQKRNDWANLVSQKKVHTQLLQEISIRRQLEERLRQIARLDALSGLNNRNAFLDFANMEFQRARRYADPLSLMILDVDFFKRINDNYGHATGDEVIKKIGQLLSHAIRNIDIAGRLGGEEFVILLPHAPIEAAYEVAERLRLAFRDLHIETHKGPLFLTVSIGIAQCLQKDIGIEATLSRADKALYLAKESGRNQAIAASTDEAE